MNLFNRLSDLLAFNQTPSAEERMIRLIGDMEASVAQARCSAALAIAAERRIGHELARQRGEVARRERQARQAVAADNDDGARRALQRKRHHEGLVQNLMGDQAVVRLAVAGVRASLRVLEDRMLATRCEQVGQLARHRAALSCLDLEAAGDTPRGRFDRLGDTLEALHRELEVEVDEALGVSGAGGIPGIEAELEALKREFVTPR